MFQNENEGREVAIQSEGERLFITVAWEKIEHLRSYLAREGVNTTEHLEPSSRTARLEAWEGTDAQHLQSLLAGWEPRRVAAVV
jgi:hypothetical protein